MPANYSKATKLNALYTHWMYLGTPAEIYIYGTQYWLIIVSIILMGFTVSTVYLPVFTTLKVSSSYEVIFYILLLFLCIPHFLSVSLVFPLSLSGPRSSSPRHLFLLSLSVYIYLYLHHYTSEKYKTFLLFHVVFFLLW